MHYIGEGEKRERTMLVTKSVNFPVNDGSFVVVSERVARFLADSDCKSVRVSKRQKKGGTIVCHFYVMDIFKWLVNEVKVFNTLRRTVVEVERFHLTLPGEGMIYHDGSNSYLPENFRRDEWPELDKTVLEPKVQTLKSGQTAEALRIKQAEWLNSSTLYETALRQTKRVGDGDTNDIVQAAFLATLEKVNAGLCDAACEAQLCSFFLATCQNKTSELTRKRKDIRKSHEKLTDDFAEGEQHHVRRTAPKMALDEAASNYGAHRDSNVWKHQSI
jgi:hypothetical protein